MRTDDGLLDPRAGTDGRLYEAGKYSDNPKYYTDGERAAHWNEHGVPSDDPTGLTPEQKRARAKSIDDWCKAHGIRRVGQ